MAVSVRVFATVGEITARLLLWMAYELSIFD
jgi:hypothetical protein